MPINPELFLAFCLASAALIALPGPVVTLVVATSLKSGTRVGLLAVAGASLGNLVLVTMAAVGITSIHAVLADIFPVVRYAGAAYLIWLGIREWRARDTGSESALPSAMGPRRAAAVIGQGFLIGVTNPKAILFYIAFLPQFLDDSLPAAPQLIAMVAAFMAIALLLDAAYALLAGRVRRHMVNPALARLRQRVTGTLLIGTGLFLAVARR